MEARPSMWHSAPVCVAQKRAQQRQHVGGATEQVQQRRHVHALHPVHKGHCRHQVHPVAESMGSMRGMCSPIKSFLLDI
jgi:hypothetical protein